MYSPTFTPCAPSVCVATEAAFRKPTRNNSVKQLCSRHVALFLFCVPQTLDGKTG